jgi:hypothetical protein
VTAIPAIGGMMMARMPAIIITTLSAMVHPKDFLSSVDGAIVVVLMTVPPSNYKQRMFRCKNRGVPRRALSIAALTAGRFHSLAIQQ